MVEAETASIDEASAITSTTRKGFRRCDGRGVHRERRHADRERSASHPPPASAAMRPPGADTMSSTSFLVTFGSRPSV